MRLRIRVLADSRIAIGPGKADLLDAVAETGSIAAAARRMRMSYRRAWLLVDTMNGCFGAPLVAKEKGGPHGGGATLTRMGRSVLAKYRSLSRSAERTFNPLLRRARRK